MEDYENSVDVVLIVKRVFGESLLKAGGRAWRTLQLLMTVFLRGSNYSRNRAEILEAEGCTTRKYIFEFY